MSHPHLAGLELSWALHIVPAQQPVLEQSRHGRRLNRRRSDALHNPAPASLTSIHAKLPWILSC